MSEQIMMKGSEHKKQLLINYYQEDEKEVAATTEKNATVVEPEKTIIPAEEKHICHQCGAEKVEMQKKRWNYVYGLP